MRLLRILAALTALAAATSGPLQAASNDLYLPPSQGDWETTSCRQAGWDCQRLDEAIEFARRSRSSAVLVLLEGRILAERYWSLGDLRVDASREVRYRSSSLGTDPHGGPIEDVASVQKSVISLLAAIARDKGLLDIEAPVSRIIGSGWSRAAPEQEAQITVRHLLEMSSGLNRRLRFGSPAGQEWEYNTAAYAAMVFVLSRVSGMEPREFTAKWLTDPLSMSNTAWRRRPALARFRPTNPLGLTAGARDLGRLGLLVANRGVWQGKPLLKDRSLLEEVFRPSQKGNRGYGLLWWLNDSEDWMEWDGGQRDGRFIPAAPPDLVAARGLGDRRLYVVPSMGLVVVRLGVAARFDDNRPDSLYFDREFWKRLMRAAPESRSGSEG